MSRSLSERQLRIAFAIAVAGLSFSALGFYLLQNSGALPGGKIAPVKMARLAFAILFWYVLPALLLLDARLPRLARYACAVLLVNMLSRAVAELFMMYVTNSWHPWMGISHNIFSFVLMLLVAWPVLVAGDIVYASYLLIAIIMFVPETLFAWYMLTAATPAGVTTFFVPGDPAHQGILILTSLCVASLLVYLFFFARRWLYGRA